jgi:hypothetical protein
LLACEAMKLIPLAVCVVACGGSVAERPLNVQLGIPREEAKRALRAHAFCPDTTGRQKLEIYPRCERPGVEWGEAWVAARYDDADMLVEVRRFERYSDDAVAVERWSQLVLARSQLSPETPDALEALRARGPVEPGTRSVKAFRIDPSTLAIVYLLTPTPPEEASVLEAIVRVRPK